MALTQAFTTMECQLLQMIAKGFTSSCLIIFHKFCDKFFALTITPKKKEEIRKKKKKFNLKMLRHIFNEEGDCLALEKIGKYCVLCKYTPISIHRTK